MGAGQNEKVILDAIDSPEKPSSALDSPAFSAIGRSKSACEFFVQRENEGAQEDVKTGK